jgi:hypothetical protein
MAPVVENPQGLAQDGLNPANQAADGNGSLTQDHQGVHDTQATVDHGHQGLQTNQGLHTTAGLDDLLDIDIAAQFRVASQGNRSSAPGAQDGGAQGASGAQDLDVALSCLETRIFFRLRDELSSVHDTLGSSLAMKKRKAEKIFNEGIKKQFIPVEEALFRMAEVRSVLSEVVEGESPAIGPEEAARLREHLDQGIDLCTNITWRLLKWKVGMSQRRWRLMRSCFISLRTCRNSSKERKRKSRRTRARLKATRNLLVRTRRVSLARRTSKSSTTSPVSTLVSTLVLSILALVVVSSRVVLPRPASHADSLAISLHGVQTRLLLLPMLVDR